MYKEDLTLNNLQWLICHKTKPNQTKLNQILLRNATKSGLFFNIFLLAANVLPPSVLQCLFRIS